MEVFLVPLRDSQNAGKKIVSSEDLRIIFNEIEVIAAYNSLFLKELEQRVTNNWYVDIDKKLGDVFKKITSFLRVYTTYINNFDKSITTIANLRKNSRDFSAFIEFAQNTKRCGGLPLNAYMIMPVQRIPRYVLLLNQLVENTIEGHSDYNALKESLRDMKQLAEYIEGKKAEAESVYEVISVQDKLMGKFDNIVAPGRAYKTEGTVRELMITPPKNSSMSKLMKKRTNAGGTSHGVLVWKIQERHLFLFTDLLVVAKKANSSFTKIKQKTKGLKALKKGTRDSGPVVNPNAPPVPTSPPPVVQDSDNSNTNAVTWDFVNSILLTKESTIVDTNPGVYIDCTEEQSTGVNGTAPGGGFQYVLQVVSENKSFAFSLDTSEDKENWYNLLTKVVADLKERRGVKKASVSSLPGTPNRSGSISPVSGSMSPVSGSMSPVSGSMSPVSTRKDDDPPDTPKTSKTEDKIEGKIESKNEAKLDKLSNNNKSVEKIEKVTEEKSPKTPEPKDRRTRERKKRDPSTKNRGEKNTGKNSPLDLDVDSLDNELMKHYNKNITTAATAASPERDARTMKQKYSGRSASSMPGYPRKDKKPTTPKKYETGDFHLSPEKSESHKLTSSHTTTTTTTTAGGNNNNNNNGINEKRVRKHKSTASGDHTDRDREGKEKDELLLRPKDRNKDNRDKKLSPSSEHKEKDEISTTTTTTLSPKGSKEQKRTIPKITAKARTESSNINRSLSARTNGEGTSSSPYPPN